jgi:fatty-acid peroxygenase
MATTGSSGAALPRDRAVDNTLALLREGYGFVSSRCARLGSGAFETRLMLQRVVCARGADAAAMFYHPGRFTRRRAIPPTVVALLQGFGSVQMQDGETHRHRKRMFLSLLDAGGTARLVDLVREEWRRRVAEWPRRDEVVLHTEVEDILCRAVCRWAGVPLAETDAQARAREFGLMIDGAGAFGPRWLRGWWRRLRTERWIRSVVRVERDRPGGSGTPLGVVAGYRGPDGTPLSDTVAALEVINLLRPTVAVARWVTFGALALHRHPGIHERLRKKEPRLLLNFVQEVRRHSPFFPMVGGRVLAPFEWRGRRFRAGDWVMLDLYGTNHDPALWHEPGRFDPDRFDGWRGGLFDLIPQGAGDVAGGHRCPGEDPSIALTMAMVGELATGLAYEVVPGQDLRCRLDRFPSIPESRFVIRAVRPVA